MLHKDNIISTPVSEAVEKIPTDEKVIANAPLCVLPCTATAYTKSRPTCIANSRKSCLLTRIHPVYLKQPLKTFYIKFSYTEKGAIIRI